MKWHIPTSIFTSDTYKQIMEKAERGEVITDNNPLWKDIEDMVLLDSPDFHSALNILTGWTMNTEEFHTALLIKCRINFNMIGTLTGVARTTVGSRRGALGFKIFGKKVSLMDVDAIIMNL